MILGHFDARTMTEVVNKRPVVPTLLRELFFSRDPRTLPTKYSEMELLVGGKKILPFVSDGAAGTVIEKLGREAQTVKTPRLRPKKRFGATELLDFSKRGEIHYVQGNNVAERVEATLVLEMDDMLTRLAATEEYMCSRALTGSLAYNGEDHAFTIDFRRPAAHKVVLGAGETWGAAGVSILDLLEQWSDLILEETGLAADTLLLGKNAWTALRKDEEILKLLDNRRMGGGDMPLRLTKMRKGELGELDLYRYGGLVTGHDDTPLPLLDPDCVILGSSAADCQMQYGLPEELSDLGPTRLFAKTWREEDPSALWQLIESRPLPLPRQPGAFVYARVL